MKIELAPTPDFEVFKGVQFRIYEGVTDNGIKLQMLGMFRIADVGQRQKFAEEVCRIEHDRPPTITPLIMTPSLVTDAPPESARKIALLRRVLTTAKDKLVLYRAARQNGDYVGGVEHNHLMDQIEEALR